VCTAESSLIERKPPPRGGFLFTMFPDQEPVGRGPPLKTLINFWGGSSGGGGFFRSSCSNACARIEYRDIRYPNVGMSIRI